jgi:hypothetical protein
MQGPASSALLPYTQDIHLLDCHVAGTSHLDLAGVEPQLLSGDLLVLRREPDNPHDPLAILILDRRGAKLGYIPRAKNEVLARLMDAGKLLRSQLGRKAWEGAWLKLEISVFMRDL